MKKMLLLLLVAFVINVVQMNDAKAQVPSKSIPAAQFYEGGQDAMYKTINSALIYPALAKRKRIQGECICTLIIEADGRVSGGMIVKDIGSGCGTEALRVLKLLKFKPIGYKTDVNIPVYFKL